MKRILSLVLSIFILPVFCIPIIAAVPTILPDVIVTPLSLVVSENQTSATFSVYLSSEPTDDVTIPMVSSDSFELTIDRATITFTNNDYNIPQIVTVTGVDDDLIDGDKNVFVVLGTIFSYDVNYDGLNPTDVSVTVQDNDQVVTPLSIVSSNPEDGSLNVPWGVTLTITFSENIQVAENIGKVIIDNAGVLYGYTYKVRGTTLYLNPKGNFQYNSLCIITLPMGVVKSLSGSSISNDYSYSFRVKAKR